MLAVFFGWKQRPFWGWGVGAVCSARECSGTGRGVRYSQPRAKPLLGHVLISPPEPTVSKCDKGKMGRDRC